MSRAPRTPTALVLLAAALPACGADPSGAAGPDGADEPLPPVFDWVGTWTGTATGSDRGVPREERVTLVIAFDTHEECELCVRVDLGDLFDRDSLVVTDPIQTELAYVDREGREHRLELRRHSTGAGAPGTTLIGRVEVRAAAADPGAGELLQERDLIVDKEIR